MKNFIYVFKDVLERTRNSIVASNNVDRLYEVALQYANGLYKGDRGSYEDNKDNFPSYAFVFHTKDKIETISAVYLFYDGEFHPMASYSHQNNAMTLFETEFYMKLGISKDIVKEISTYLDYETAKWPGCCYTSPAIKNYFEKYFEDASRHNERPDTAIHEYSFFSYERLCLTIDKVKII